MRVLVTGGAGYIGSHTVLELLQKGYEVTVVDNLINSSEESLRRVTQITGKKVEFHNFDACDKDRLRALFKDSSFDAVIHFAGFKAVGESVEKPLMYYKNNVGSTISLCEVMQEFDVKKLVFSSSCTVYGNPDQVPVKEDAPIKPVNPYGQTKAVIEQILKDLVATNAKWQVSILRYFNPVGAHESGLIGEDPNGIPNNLLPYITQVLVGKLQELSVFGDDYPTQDGTCVRDYVHVMDLAEGHVAALENMPPSNAYETYNLATGKGSSVIDVIKSFEKATAKKVPHKIVGRRPGDTAIVFCDPAKSEKYLRWRAKRTLDEACADAWRWQSKNPNGYK